MQMIKSVAMASLVISTTLASINADAGTITLKGGLNGATESLANTSDIDYLTFSISGTSTINAKFNLATPGGMFDMSAISVMLYKDGNMTALATSGSVTNYTYLNNLAAGSYYFSVQGLPTGFVGGEYVYSVNISPATPVPEASTSAMLLLGLSFLGYRARRKNA